MLEALFGADMPLAVRFFLAFLIVLGLIGATAWAVRRLPKMADRIDRVPSTYRVGLSRP
jgi:flagellar biogenesis protein FliO